MGAGRPANTIRAMGRLRPALAVVPALLPGALVALLAFQAGGFYPGSWAPVATIGAVAMALRIATVDRPFAGFSVWSGVAAGALALLGAWMLLSAGWSHAPGRALLEFGRLSAYLVVFVLCASLAPRDRRLDWAIRGVVLAIAAVCVAALITRLRPDLWNAPGLQANRLDFPITYWNGLGLLAGVGVVLSFHLTASSSEARVVRVLAAAVPVVCATTVYLTLSRGAIIATGIAVVAYFVVGFSRATPGALLAVVPPCAIALSRVYDLDILVSTDYARPDGLAEGREAVRVLVAAVAASVVLRALALLIDRLLGRAPGPERLPRAARVGIPVALVAVAAAIAVALGAPDYAHRQVDTFLSASPNDTADVRDRLKIFNNNGRVDHWNVALDAWRADRLHGNGAGTFQNLWNRDRKSPFQVLDAHSLYLEVMGELGAVGLVLLLAGLLALTGGLIARVRRPNRPAVAAVLAAALAWLVHAGVDWDWELTAITVWLFGLAAIAIASRSPSRRLPMPRLLRLVAALGCLLLALSPFAIWRSQVQLEDAVAAFRTGDCPKTVDQALASLEAVDARAEPWELIAYCDVRLGQTDLAIGAAQAAVRRDPDNWEYRYALALVRGAARKDPRAAAREARRLNPLQPEPPNAVKAFATRRPALWERRARRLPLYLP